MSAIYAPLNRERKEIRLLTILSASDEHETKCSLETVSLLDQPDFEALSYCWGDPTLTTDIILCGRKVPVTLNLGHALKQFRESAVTAWTKFWVDALCINQADVDERGHQVSMMRDVYTAASNVCIWLGDEGASTEREFYVLKCLMNDQTKLVRHRWLDQQEHPDFTQHWDALVDFFRDPYWHRTWTTQERVLANSLTIQRGSHWQPVPSTLVFSKNVVTYLNACGRDVQIGLAQQSAPCWTYSRQFASDTASILKALGRQRAFRPCTGESLNRFLQYVRGAQASDPRDCVYGILGLFPEFSIVPNYNKTLENVFEDLALAAIQADQSFDLFYQVTPTNLRLPSWAADLRDGAITETKSLPHDRCFNFHDFYNASSSTSFQTPELVDAGILCISALIVDKIIETKPFQRRPGFLSAPLLPRDGDDSFIRTLWADVIYDSEKGDNRRFESEDLDRCRKILRELDEDVLTAEGTDFVRARLVNLSEALQMCSSEKGRSGLVPSYVLPGDFVCILPSANMPMCIRKVNGGTDRYRFVSTIYLHGIMDGEAVLEASQSAQEEQIDLFQDILLE